MHDQPFDLPLDDATFDDTFNTLAVIREKLDELANALTSEIAENRDGRLLLAASVRSGMDALLDLTEGLVENCEYFRLVALSALQRDDCAVAYQVGRFQAVERPDGWDVLAPHGGARIQGCSRYTAVLMAHVLAAVDDDHASFECGDFRVSRVGDDLWQIAHGDTQVGDFYPTEEMIEELCALLEEAIEEEMLAEGASGDGEGDDDEEDDGDDDDT
jgi:hypothetical protein